LLLILLFRGSTAFSEEISAGKYPGYAEYQQRVSRFLPLPKDWLSRSHRKRSRS
jgi:steroid 5-alpha reductase family enzyme